MELMSETEFLLREARDIAARTLPDPTEAAVLAVFHRLCLEADLAAQENAGAGRVAH